ncbi:MAG: hypothetical protein HY840_06555 [Bacteroidetes bacterium]|nr:hypothetical protein [Bacteroidota bacterium]
MKIKNRILAALLIILGYFSCTKDIVETNISGSAVTLLSPQNNDTSVVLTQLFWWNEVKGALKYNLQIVKPSFTNANQLVLDSNVAGTKFSVTLTPGIYQWRVKAKNASSETPYSEIRTLKIDSTTNLSAQAVVLVSPANGDISNRHKQTFVWNPLYNATEYRFQVIDQSSSTLIDAIITKDSATYTLVDGQYTWQVRAQNASSNSTYSSRTLTIDSVAPAPSVPLLPANKDTITSPDTLTWTRTTAVYDSLFIYPDSLFSSVSFKAGTASTSAVFTTSVKGDYFWRLKSKDAAGNWSGYSTPLYKFWIK